MAIDDTVRLPLEEIRSLSNSILSRQGFSNSDAAEITDVLVWADLRGHHTHGVVRIPRYVDFVVRGDLDPKARPLLSRVRPSVGRVDGKRASGPIAMKLGVDTVVEMARASGVAWIGVGNTTHVGALGVFVERIAQTGMAGICFAAGSPLMAYHGSTKASLSSSPIAFGIPRTGSPPLIFDMASSVAAQGKIRQARSEDRKIPEDWALTSDGEATTDPRLAEILLPLGGPKGSGLSLIFEILSSVVFGAPIIAPAVKQSKRHIQNATLIALDVEAFIPASDFSENIERLIASVKSLPIGSGVSEIRLPGERGSESYRKSLADGLALPRSTWDELNALLLKS